MTSGLEWNIKLSQYDSGDILEKIRATFEGYWNNPEFTPFIAALDSERLRKALKSERRTNQDEAGNVAFNFDIKPYYYQQEILDKLHAEREVHHSFKNLVVAATGTGKTVIAAFDYRDFCKANPGKANKLLCRPPEGNIKPESGLLSRDTQRSKLWLDAGRRNKAR